AGPVDAIVDIRIDPLIELVNGVAQRRRVEIERIAGQRIERRVENTDDLRRFVVDDPALLPVPQHWHSYPAGVVWRVCGVEFTMKAEPVDRVASAAGGAIVGPAVAAHDGADDREANQAIEPLEM